MRPREAGVLSVKAYAVVSALLFGLGVYGALSRKHAIAVFISVELMLNAAALNFTAFSRLTPAPQAVSGQLFAVFIITVAAAEAIVGLALVLALFRSRGTASLDRFDLLKW
jgi:NADH:ubiquinone oxidoreductase subunit K